LVSLVLLRSLAFGAVFMAVVLTGRVRRLGWRRGLKVLAGHDRRRDLPRRFLPGLVCGFGKNKAFKREPHQTPLEFASQVGLSEAASITKAYNRVRYGEENCPRQNERRLNCYYRRLNAAGSRIETQRNANRCLEYHLVGLLDAIKAD